MSWRWWEGALTISVRFAASDVFRCLHNQLSSFDSVIVQMSEKRDSSNRQ